ncbi:type II toxin-antitoxin system HipA family toxin [Alkalimarinus sediminis]|uniref:Type II toxin-antitoxin system HipA family toxin n=1 Tax=Alkalimarinus sediminis TaxID=1632866 RepID=A0A9E8HIG6_9ALTE|nr:type II toxin-antitoxin system HipA family toxin [Alkalimarinus sediminis]UZW74965.1 type II toxin-antitoxin system HipA family toxin [Alkalimarinus sediminis]
MASVDVYVNSHEVGQLQKEQEKHIFSYGLDTEEALSLTMPVRIESYNQPSLHPVFQMNLPEGHLRQAIERATAKQYGSNDLSMLALLGSNQIGRIAYTIAGQPLPENKDTLPDLKTLLASTDVSLFEQLLGRFATCSGVAGVQPKVLLSVTDEIPAEQQINITSKATLPFQSYIVKSWGPEYPELGCNEFVCLTLARNAGLQVPEFYLSDNGKLLVSKRFDLDETGNALGFEDFCVLQGKGTREKYDASLESCANTIRQFVSPEDQQQALYDFFKLTLINIMVRNGDAHLKNIGVIYPSLQSYKSGELPSVRRQLAPIFDIVSTVPYIPSDTMALSLTGSKRWPKWKVLQRFAVQHCGLNNKNINQAVKEVEQASKVTLSLVNELAQEHEAFSPIAQVMATLMAQSLLDDT